MRVVDSRDINVTRLRLTGGSGVVVQDSALAVRTVTVDSSRAAGISAADGSTVNLLSSSAALKNVVENNCGGIVANIGASIGVNNDLDIKNNLGPGIAVSGFVNLNAGTGEITIEGNTGPGVLVNPTGNTVHVGGSGNGIKIINNGGQGLSIAENASASVLGNVLIQNNSMAAASNPNVSFPAGVWVRYGGALLASAGVQISGNYGPGIWAIGQAKVVLVTPTGGVSIIGNHAGGLRLEAMSLAISQGPNVIDGNGGHADATCDESSWLHGDRSGIGTVRCSNKAR